MGGRGRENKKKPGFFLAATCVLAGVKHSHAGGSPMKIKFELNQLLHLATYKCGLVLGARRSGPESPLIAAEGTNAGYKLAIPRDCFA